MTDAELMSLTFAGIQILIVLLDIYLQYRYRKVDRLDSWKKPDACCASSDRTRPTERSDRVVKVKAKKKKGRRK